MGNVSDLETARRRRIVSRFCTQCHTPWALRARRLNDGLVITCRACGHVRATIPVLCRDPSMAAAGVPAPLSNATGRPEPRST